MRTPLPTKRITALPPITAPLSGEESLECVQIGNSVKLVSRHFVLPTDPLLTFADVRGSLPGSRPLVPEGGISFVDNPDGTLGIIAPIVVPGLPTALVGLTPIAGTSDDFMRADAAPALDQTISPVWSGDHVFTGLVDLSTATVVGVSFTDAQTLEGLDGDYYLDWNNFTNVPSEFPPAVHAHDTADITSGIFAPARLPIFTDVTAGAVPASGGGTANFLRSDGSWVAISIISASDPTALSGRVAAVGVASTYMRSDAAPALDFTALFTPALAGFAPASGGGTANFLRADGSWAAPVAAATDHGTLTGLTDDDHPQYLTNARGDSRYPLMSASGGGTANFLRADGVWAVPPGTGGGGGGLVDGDMGDITVGGGGTTLTIDDKAVTYAKIQDVTTGCLLGRASAGDGVLEEITLGTNLSFTGTTLNAAGGGSGSPGGATTQVQFNNSGAFAGDADFTWDSTNNILAIGRSGTPGIYTTTAAASATSAGNSTTVRGGASGATSGNGGQLILRGGGATTGVGGQVSMEGGQATATGAGGQVLINGGAGIGGNSNGGAVTIEGGRPVGTGQGGAVSIGGGDGVTTGASGGSLTLAGGQGLGTGSGGFISITSGPSATAANAGYIRLRTGTTATVERFRILANGAWSIGSAGTETGTSGQVLTSTGATTPPTWQNAVGGAVAGSTTQIQYNNAGAFGASADFTFTSGTSTVTLGGSNYGQLKGANTGNPGIMVTGGNPSGAAGGFAQLTGGNSVAATFAGGAVTVKGGAGNTTGAGGNVTVMGGNGGATGVSGNTILAGGVGGSTIGYVVVQTNSVERFRVLANGAWSVGSTGAETGTSGQVLTSAGSGGPPTWQNAGGAVPGTANQTIYNNGTVLAGLNIWTADVASNRMYLGTGAAAATIQGRPPSSGSGSNVSILASDAAVSAGNGGTLTIRSGAPFGAGNSGDLNLSTPNSQATGQGGSINLTAGNGTATAGSIAGAINLTAGLASEGTGGLINITAGVGSGNAHGGTITLQAGYGGGTNKNGGNVILQSRWATGSGISGNIQFHTGPADTAPVERFRILGNGAWSVGSAGTNTGTSGQVLTSTGASTPPTWQTAGGGSVDQAANYTWTGTHTFTVNNTHFHAAVLGRGQARFTGGYGVNSSDVLGPGVELGYGGGAASIAGYNRTGGGYVAMALDALSVDFKVSGTSKAYVYTGGLAALAVVSMDQTRAISFTPDTYGSVIVSGASGSHAGYQIGDGGVRPLFMSNGTNAGLYILGDTKWLLFRSDSVTATSGYNLNAPAFNVSSSRTLKIETGAPKNVASILRKLRPVLYRLISDPEHEQIGGISEEVHEICPWLSHDGKTISLDRLSWLLLTDWQERYSES